MFKYAAIAAILSASGFCCTAANAGESRSMLDGNFSLASNGISASESEAPVAHTRDDSDAVGAMREAGSMHGSESAAEVATHHRARPDSTPAAPAVRTDRAHTAIGVDDAADAPARKIRGGTSWQSLLPGVMK